MGEDSGVQTSLQHAIVQGAIHELVQMYHSDVSSRSLDYPDAKEETLI